MKRIIDIPEEVVRAIQNGQDYRYDIHTAIAQGKPYEERPQGDLISREALKKSFEDTVCIEPMPYAFVKQIIDNAPSVDIKDEIAGAYNEGYACGSRENTRPQGEWIKDAQGDTICSNCGFECLYNEEELYSLGRYCHHCGAKMKGGAE